MMNLFQRINEVRKEVSYIQKDKSVSTGGGSYKAVTHDMVTAMTRGYMVAHGIVSYPVLIESKSMPFEIAPDGTKAKQFRYEATYDFHFVNVDDLNDRVTLRIQAHAMDNADKAPGKALSYAKKYAVLKLLDLETGEDDESRAPEEFDTASHIKAINDAENLDALKTVFASSFKAAENAKDKDAMKSIIAAKDRRKESLTKAASNAPANS